MIKKKSKKAANFSNELADAVGKRLMSYVFLQQCFIKALFLYCATSCVPNKIKKNVPN